MEFKGTKGKWSVSDMVRQNKHGVTCIDIDCIVNGSGISGLAVVYEGITEYGLIEMHANALLISKAPEMLEMLNKIAIARRNGQEMPLLEIENLIQSATELKEIKE